MTVGKNPTVERLVSPVRRFVPTAVGMKAAARGNDGTGGKLLATSRATDSSAVPFFASAVG